MDELKSFTNQMDSWIDGVLETLNWTREGLLQTESRCECPVNPEHTMDAASLERHMQYCPLVAAGYTKEELDKDQSSKFFYENSPSVLTLDLDETVMRNILTSAGGPVPDVLPMTNDRATTDLTVAQRLKIYEHCVEVGRASNVRSQISEEDLMLFELNLGKEEKPQSKLELLAKMRDLKRRRQSYRGKNTHTGKKNHTEIIRDVIASQMEMLSRMWEKQEKDELKRKQEKTERAKKERKDTDDSKSRTSYKPGRHETSPKSRRSRERKQSGQKEQSQERMQSRERERSRERKHGRERERSQETKHGRERSQERKLSLEREQSEERKSGQEREPSKERSPDRERSSERHRGKHKSKSSKKRRRSKDSDEQHKHKKHKRSKEGNDKRSKDQSDKHSKESQEHDGVKLEDAIQASDVKDLKDHEAKTKTDS